MTFSKKQWLIGCICLAVGLAFYIYRTGGEKPESSLQTSDMIKAESSAVKKEGESSDQVISSQDSPFVMVDIKGAVQKPGVYQLPKDARVKDALAQAGGATKEADLRQLNLASKLQDEMAVYIPAAGEEIRLHLQFLQSLPQELQMISPLLISIQRTLMNCKR